MKLRFTDNPFLSTGPPCTWMVPSLLVILICLIPLRSRAENWDRYNGWEITSFKVIGVPEDIPPEFQIQLALHGQRKLLGLKRPPFKTRMLAEDLARIRLLLARNGYPHAQTYPVAETKAESQQLSLRIEVDPGPPVRVGSIELKGWPSRVAFPDTSRQGVIHENQVFRDEDIEKVTKFLRSRLLNSGFESAVIKSSLSGISEGRVDLHFEVEAGLYSVLDSLVIEGCSDDLKSVARRVMDWKPGREYSQERMRQAGLDLRGTQLFGHVELNTENIQPGHLLLKTTLENARMRTWRAGVGTWLDNPWMVRLGWTHVNLFKHGVGFNAEGVFGEYEKSLGADVFWLGWLTPRSRTSIGLIMEDQDEDAFHSREERLDLIQAFRPNLRDIWKVGVSVSLIEVETFTPDPDEAPEAQGKMLELWSDWKWDRTDNPLKPTTGYYIKVSATVSPPEGISETPYAQFQIDGVRFQPLGGKVVLAGRMRAGASRNLGEATDILANRRFFTGGFNTMRGYTRRHLGPKDMAGDPRGGQFVALAGLELRFPLFWLFDGAAFFDSGQVWRKASEVGFGSISGAAGLALDLRTPLGPLRLNYAINVMNRVEDEPHRLWLFGIGYPW